MAGAPGSEQHRKFYAQFAKAGYDRNANTIGEYARDVALSNRNRQVYVNPNTKHVVIAERGTIPKDDTKWADLGQDALLALNMQQFGSRFKTATKNAKRTRDAYPDHKITATGHSLAGSVSQHLANKLGIEAVSYSAHLPTSQIQQEAIKSLMGARPKQKGVYNYSTLADPVGAGMVLAGKSFVVPQTGRNPHSLQNFL